MDDEYYKKKYLKYKQKYLDLKLNGGSSRTVNSYFELILQKNNMVYKLN